VFLPSDDGGSIDASVGGVRGAGGGCDANAGGGLAGVTPTVGSTAGEASTYAGGGDAGMAPSPAGGHDAGAATASAGGGSGYQIVVNRAYRGGEDGKGR